MKKITEFEIIDHGVENSQYFQGCGIAYTRFEDVATGIGSSPCDALEDAIDSLAQCDWDTSSVVNSLPNTITVPDDSEDCYHYVSIRVSSIHWASFNHFELQLPDEAVSDCAHQGSCDDDVSAWAPKIHRPADCTPEALRVELKEYGAWNTEELADDAENWKRIVWIAASNIKEEAKP